MLKKVASYLYLAFIPCSENNWQPNFLNRKVLLWSLFLLIFLKLIVVSFAYLPKTSFLADLTAALNRAALIEITNQERQAIGVNFLKVNQKLELAAYLKAQDMMAKDYFAHQSPEGISPWDWLKSTGYNYQYAGENLAIGFLDSEEVIKAWKESPSHKDNLLSPKYQEIGVAVVRGNFQGSEATLVVQFFGSPLQKKAPPQKLTEELKPKETTPKEPMPPEEPALPKEEVLPEATKEAEIIEEEELKIIAASPENIEAKSTFRFFQFMARDYPKLLEKITFYFLLLVIFALMLSIFIKIDIQDKNLIFRTIILILLLIFLVIFDKEIIIQLIPHNLLI